MTTTDKVWAALKLYNRCQSDESDRVEYLLGENGAVMISYEAADREDARSTADHVIEVVDNEVPDAQLTSMEMRCEDGQWMVYWDYR